MRRQAAVLIRANGPEELAGLLHCVECFVDALAESGTYNGAHVVFQGTSDWETKGDPAKDTHGIWAHLPDDVAAEMLRDHFEGPSV